MSDFEVTLPKLGESILSATVVRWFKKEGESIRKDEPLLEVATDKVNSEIPSPVAGVIQALHAQPEQELNVGEKLATISTSQTEGVQEEKPKETAQNTESTETVEDKSDYFSPAVLRLCKEKGISLDILSTIRGSGRGGRVTKQDIENYQGPTTQKISKPVPSAPTVPPEPQEGVEVIPLAGMRKAIAQNMVRSYYEAPHASLMDEIDVTELIKVIKREKESFFAKYQSKLSITAFVAKAMCQAIKEYPLFNASLQNDMIYIKQFVNLGIAVSVDEGIQVPVIRNCHEMNLMEIARTIGDFAARARSNSLLPDDVKEGSITMTNFGMSGVKMGIPIIPHPQAAIVGVGGISKEVKVTKEGDFVARDILRICISFDHRLIDGMYGCGFLTTLKQSLENDHATD